MKNVLNAILLVFSLTSVSLASTQENDATNSPAVKEFSAIEQQIRAKLQQGVRTEQGLASELKQFDALLEKYKSEKTDAVAGILLMKAQLYLQVFDDTTRGAEIIQQLQREFPETNPGRSAFLMLEAINQQENAKRLHGSLVAGAVFPNFEQKSLSGESISLKALKGKIVLVDFWATWSEGWQKTLPAIAEVYSEFHDRGFEVVGVGLDEDPAKAASFAKEKKLKWPLIVDGQSWKTKIATICGVHRLPCNYLLDDNGKILARNLSGKDFHDAIAKALPAK